MKQEWVPIGVGRSTDQAWEGVCLVAYRLTLTPKWQQ